MISVIFYRIIINFISVVYWLNK